ncbi:MAG: DNA-directed RNA polymerase subunit beta' [Actinobacteria bacterium]|nr:DNA-directed RNA polymerase subunit beta' [Actinomycetota bacterium]
MLDVNDSARLSISLATAERIRTWSNGEVKKPETINYRTLKPEKDGLFCEKIFGPTKDWECYCGKYKRVRFKGIICERCGVEVTRSKVRRERMGHIELAAPVTHIWYFKGVPSRLGYLLDIAPKSLEKVIYFAAHLITWVDAEKLHTDLPSIEAEIKAEMTDEEKRRDLDIEKRFQDLEADLAQAEEAGGKKADLDKLRKANERDVEEIRERAQFELDFLKSVYDTIRALKKKQLIDDERVWREIRARWGEYFAGGMGAEAVKDLISRLDLTAEEEELKDVIATAKGQRKAKAIKRLRVISAFNRAGEDGRPVNSPMGMVLDAVPVIPPDLRPMVQLDGGRFATSDLNDLYRRVINRNNRLKRLLDLGAPEIIINNEKRMLQEAVDALFDNGRRGRPVTGPGNRALKSLSDMLKGKQGRFRQNLLGKRVDYSGRSVIVVGPRLKLRQCGLPKQMALELFKPFVMKRLVDLEYAQNIKSAKRMVERARPQVWDVLEDVIKEHPVFLNRAPTLHRLGIQAFEPVLVEGKAIQIHPLVCAAFNADFDGDQMAVHLPLSSEAQAEARLLMLSAHNILSPAHGRPIAVPSQDMIIGAFYLTELVEGAPGEGRVFSSLEEARMAHELRDEQQRPELNVHARIKVRMPAGRFPEEQFPTRDDDPASPVLRRNEANGREASVVVETTLGRLLFNEAFPPDFPFKERVVKKRDITEIVGELVDRYTKSEVATSLDALKDLGFEYSTRAGLTISIADVRTPVAKTEILAKHEDEADKVERQYDRGIITDDERRQKEIEIWTEATNRVTEAMQTEQRAEQFNPIEMMVGSGARGNVMQVRQIAGMRGLVANPRGEIIPRPIKSNFREGLSVLEYFISTHGARKGLADTALRTADSGYLTRRLVDVAQELIVRDEDCASARGIWVEHVTEDPEHARALETGLLGRCLAEDVTGADGEVLARNTEVTDEVLARLKADAGVDRVRVRSVLTCEYPRDHTGGAPADDGDEGDEKYRAGVCSLCYGTMLATGKLVDLGEAIGIIAAQSIGEPGTQLTMRTFHTGGVAGEDITHGLPRVVELFEARTPKGAAVLAESSGVVRVGENEKGERTLTVVADDGEEEVHAVSMRTHLAPGVVDGAEVLAGAQLTGDAKSSRDPKKILDIEGIRATQQYLVDEVQRVYREQGVSIHDKHVEVIVRQMLRRVGVSEPGDSQFLPGQKADAREFANVNKRLVAEGKRPAEGRPELMGITKASLATESWLSAASFQETTRVLTEAAIEGKNDGLEGLKENVIIGKLIPAGTGMPRYRDVGTEAPDYQPLEFYSSDYEDALDLAERLRASLDDRTEADDLSPSFLVPPENEATDTFAPPAGGLVPVPDPTSEPGEAAAGE